MTIERVIVERVDETGQTSIDFALLRHYLQPAGRGAPEGFAQISSLSEDWYTHPCITDLVRELYGGVIDLDPMSCVEANENVKATKIYTAQDDGLTFEWRGKVFLNPPWGGASATSTKMRAIKKVLFEYQCGRVAECVLVLNSNATTTAWFEPLFGFPMCFPSRRIPHTGPGGGVGGAPNSGTVIVYMGEHVDRFARIFHKLGNVVGPISRATSAAVAAGENYECE